MAEALQTYIVTSKAGEFVAGTLSAGAGTVIRLTEAQARYELLIGSIVPDGTPVTIDPPAGPINALDRLDLTRGSKAWDASVGELVAFLLTRILPEVSETLGEVEGRILGGAGLTDNTLGKLATRIATLADATRNDLESRAPLLSPAFLDIPTAPTAAPGNNSQQLATTAFVAAALAALADSTPAALDTLAELAAALGNNPNFATTMATALGNRLQVDAAQGLTAAQIVQALSNLGVSTFIRDLLDDADAAAARGTLGLGSAAVQAASAFATVLHNHAVGDVTGLQGVLDLKAPLASPAFTGSPTAPSAPVGSNDARLVNTNHVFLTIAALALGTASRANLGTAAGNVPVLDANGKLLASILPALAITDTFEVASQAAMLALAAERGDIAVRSDLSRCFILKAEPAATLANWTELKTPADVVQAVAGLTGVITAAQLRNALALATADIAGLDIALGNRLRVDAAQGLTAPQIVQALSNLGVSAFIRTLLDDGDAAAARGTLGLGSGTTPIFSGLQIDAAASTMKAVTFASGSTPRWQFGSDSTAESGSNAGANLFVNAFGDNGAYIGTPMSINRSTGLMTVGALSTSALSLLGRLALGSYTVGTVPAGAVGAIIYASNGRKVGEGAGAGTGVVAAYSNGAWRRLSDDTPIAA